MAGLTEIWRAKNPTARCFSHISHTRSSARIDLAFGSPVMLLYVKEVEYLAGGLSDHSPLSVSLALPSMGDQGGGDFPRVGYRTIG